MAEPNLSHEDIAALIRKGGVLDGPVEREIQTHMATVFLTPQGAWKLRKPLHENFCDLSTLALRQQAAEREMEINRKMAEPLYLGVHRLTETPGGLELDGPGDELDWLVQMRRFPDDALLSTMLMEDRLGWPLMAQLTDKVLTFHRQALPVPDAGGREEMARIVRENADNLRRNLPHSQHPRIGLFEDLMGLRLDHAGDLLEARKYAGYVRRCHGDLHLGNICLWRDEPVPFDAIEFSERIGSVDVLYDLAYLVMDLAYRHRPDLAVRALSRYLAAESAYGAIMLMPFFIALRASVRAMVHAFEGEPEATAYLDLAVKTAAPQKAHLLAVGGRSGSGKSTLAYGLAEHIAPVGHVAVISSDELRKRLFDLPPEAPLPQEAYSGEVSDRVYDQMYTAASGAIASGGLAIMDATFLRPQDRAMGPTLAARSDAQFDGFWLDAPTEKLKQRVRDRSGDASDADERVVDMQASQSSGIVDWPLLQSGDTVPIAKALDLLGKA